MFYREIAELHLRPMQIRHVVGRNFGTPLHDLSEKVAQNYVNHYSRTYLENHDRVDDLRNWIHARDFTGNEAKDQPFTFAWNMDSGGKLIVGDGSDQRSFVVGTTTKGLVMQVLQPPDSFIQHMDAT
ncbi:hypothetical protein PPTG_24684 [Phytophthora nicotianae INRA-310]|uniref:Uncharacterized protein n=1 Tax=Phytophthora nicotianae (strain INRA-310) TaxID=761204 RepID=W2PDG2_PHYN3|nr:hypothetical protein PPTG_24684 [Phytophthora nicotianae INRA-310]ETM98243.1 hypothetical protein PPTG_24684 [Phytophthora nicotianae INRA-310]